MSAPLEDFLKSKRKLRYIFTGGKGGVGKTIAAAGVALRFAERGERVLLASLNPVHSLSSLFNVDLRGGQPKAVNGSSRLHAQEVGIKDAVEKYRQRIGERVGDFLKWADIPLDARPFIEIAATNPAFEESAMFDRMVDIILQKGEQYDRIVFDTAAVANAVRLIGLSKIYGLWLGRMIQSRREALEMRLKLAFRRDKVEQEMKQDPMMADLLDMNERFKKAKVILTDPDLTAFFFVTLPLSLPIAVVKRFIRMVRGFDIPVGGVVVNSVMAEPPPKEEDPQGYLTNKFQEQLSYMGDIKNDLGDLVRSFIPLYPQEVVGLDSIRKVSEDMFSYTPPFWENL
ncbi:MAG: ArsA family ATPase [Thermoplasmata archaeon]